jgi:acetyl-CoA carboxylase biotin carboxyl carrier protein
LFDPDKIVSPEKIKALVEMMAEYELSEISLKSGDHEIRLSRPGRHVAPHEPHGHGMSGSPTPAHVVSATALTDASSGPQEASLDKDLLRIESPMVGTFYSGPDPQQPPFVVEGASVSEQTVVCIIEAMKVFNEIKAGVSGTIAKVVVRNEEPVEYGQPLFLVRPN